MKKKLIYTFVILFLLSMVVYNNTNASSCATLCTYNGCNVALVQGSGSWSLSMVCSDGFSHSETGSGLYGGTICGGVTPCTPHIQ